MSNDADKSEVRVFKFGEESLSDVIFIVNGNEFHCNKMFLANKSSYFVAMFASGFKEKNEKRVEINETDAVAFRRLMQILYDSRIEDEFLFDCYIDEPEVAIELWTDTCALFALADRFLVLDVVRHVVEMYFLAHEHRCTLKNNCESCAIKLLLALRFKMEDYIDISDFAKSAVQCAVGRLKEIDDDFVFSMEAAEYLLNLD